jgi:putative membrane protein insertion efficiency factor
MKRTIIFLIDTYRRFISPYVPCECRYYPSCSSYAKEAIQKKGVVKGIFLALRRVLRCNPLYPGGYDPVK